MADEAVNTVQLNLWVERMCSGNRAASDELLRATGNRLERLPRKMLGHFPDVHRWVETGDVLQNALLRLLRSLEEVRPASVRAFFGRAEADADLERWSSFREEAARWPQEERELVGLIIYHGWTQGQTVELLGISVRTV